VGAALRNDNGSSAMTIPGSDRHATPHGNSTSQIEITSLHKPGSEESNGPLRLDEALKYAVTQIEEDPLKIEIIVNFFGWDGRGARTFDQLGQSAGLPPERVVQIVACGIDRLRQTGVVPDAVERSIALAEKSVPILDAELCEALLDAKLCYRRFASDGLVSAAEVFRETSPFEAVVLGPHHGLVKSGAGGCIDQLTALAQRVMQSRGCANVRGLADESQEIFGSSASYGFAEAAVRTGPRFEWLDRENGWFWYIPEWYGDTTNRLVNQIKRVLAVTPRIRLSELRSAIRRDHRMGEFAPPLNVLSSVCQRLLFVRLEGDAVVRVAGPLQWDAVLGCVEATFVNVLRAHGPALGREEFLNRCVERGMSEDTFAQFSSCSAILTEPLSGMYALVAAGIPPEKIGEVRVGSQEHAAIVDHRRLSDGRVLIAWNLNPSALQSGELRIPDSVSSSVEGHYELRSITDHELGRIQISERTCGNMKPLWRHAGADADDVLFLVFNLDDYSAIGILGDDAVVDQVASAGIADRLIPIHTEAQVCESMSLDIPETPLRCADALIE
jgi:hypothetical protein